MIPRCALCERVCFRFRRTFRNDHGFKVMSIRVCKTCRPVVIAADISGVCQVVERDFSQAWTNVLRAA